MEQKFEEYLKALGMKQPFIVRIENLLKLTKTLLPNLEIKDILVDDHFSQEGERIFDRLRLYSDNIGIVFLNFISEDKMIMNSLSLKYSTVMFELKDYDMIKATEKSRMVITGYSLGSDRVTTIRASAENCDYTLNIFNKYMRSRVITG